MSSSDNIYESVVTVDSREIHVALNQNDLGMYLKISAKTRNARNAVIVPLSGVADLQAAVQKAVKASTNAPPRAVKSRPAKEPRVERSAEELARTVYVSRLAWATTAEGLTNHFKKAGAIANVTLNMKKRGGEMTSVGTGVVEYKSAADAQRAVAELNQSELDGRTITARADRSLTEGVPETREARAPRVRKERAPADPNAPARAPRTRREPVDFSNSEVDPKKVYVRSLSWDTTAEDLSNVFSAVGTVSNVELILRKDGRSSGAAIIEFADAGDATEAIERLNGKSLDGREMAVKVYYVK